MERAPQKRSQEKLIQVSSKELGRHLQEDRRICQWRDVNRARGWNGEQWRGRGKGPCVGQQKWLSKASKGMARDPCLESSEESTPVTRLGLLLVSALWEWMFVALLVTVHSSRKKRRHRVMTSYAQRSSVHWLVFKPELSAKRGNLKENVLNLNPGKAAYQLHDYSKLSSTPLKWFMCGWGLHPLSPNIPVIVSDGASNDLNSGLWIMHSLYSDPIPPTSVTQ